MLHNSHIDSVVKKPQKEIPPKNSNWLTPKKYLSSYHTKEFYIHGSVYRDSMLIRSNEMQQYASVYLLQN